MAGTLRTVWDTVRCTPVKRSYRDTYVDLVSGIGLEGHESPYLRGGSDDVILTGHSFSDEPGVYIEGKVSYSLLLIHASHAHANQVGVRLEDCFFIDEDGRPVFLTADVGGQAGSPWEP